MVDDTDLSVSCAAMTKLLDLQDISTMRFRGHYGHSQRARVETHFVPEDFIAKRYTEGSEKMRDASVRFAVADSCSFTGKGNSGVLEKLTRDPNPRVSRRAMTRAIAISGAGDDSWGAASDIELLEAMAREDGIPREMLPQLASSDSPIIRGIVASSEFADLETLQNLAGDNDVTVRRIVANVNLFHLRLPHKEFSKLIGDSSEDDSAGTAGDGIFCKLAADEDDCVREILASNHSISIKIYEMLSDDANIDVLKALAKNAGIRNLPTLYLEKVNARIDGTYVEPSRLREMAMSDDVNARAKAASDERSDAETLAILATDPDSRVRRAVAANKKATKKILESLITDADDGVRCFVAASSKTGKTALQTLSIDYNDGVRAAAAGNSKTDRAVVESMASDEFETVRRAVASNTNTPMEVLEKLKDDSDEMWLYGPSAPDGRPQDDGGFVLGELLYNRERDFAEHKPIWVDGRFLGYGSQDMLDALNKYSHACARYQEEHEASGPQEGAPVKIIKVSRQMDADEFEVLQQRLWTAKVPYALENADREPKGTSEERRPRVLLIPERFEDILSKYFPDLRKRSDSIESSDPEGEFGIRVRSQAFE